MTPLEKTGRIITALFYSAVVFILLKTPLPPLLPVPDKLIHDYLAADEKAYIPLGSQFADFKKMLPPSGPVTFLFDVPFTPYARGIEQLYQAQSYFTPLVLNPQPVETAAIVYCENHFIADKRMEESGYQLIGVVADGKGMAVKK